MKAKFLWYKPHVAIITGIAWDHINVYPTKAEYNKAFSDFIETIEDNGCLYYFKGDEVLSEIADSVRPNLFRESYMDFEHKVENGKTIAISRGKEYELSVFGDHNIQNMQAARLICHSLGIKDEVFFQTITSFDGASNRLELLKVSGKKRVFKDFAHSPSKLMATIKACRQQFPKDKLLAAMELHTFSSLNKDFLEEYAHCMDESDVAIVYFSPDVVEHKRLENISPEDVKKAFKRDDLLVVTDTESFKKEVSTKAKDCQTMLLMSSGNYGGLHIGAFAQSLL
jgi:UDP-N-acetylmuramate: L-alanyl-gamma-D-glutamyl-meso-diaminopimelate ligase